MPDRQNNHCQISCPILLHWLCPPIFLHASSRMLIVKQAWMEKDKCCKGLLFLSELSGSTDLKHDKIIPLLNEGEPHLSPHE